jgi:hypothetical protein
MDPGFQWNAPQVPNSLHRGMGCLLKTLIAPFFDGAHDEIFLSLSL